MGLGVTDESGGGGKDVAISCSICLDAVTDNGVRSWAKLQCGHQFHLDCIGSAFNVKGAMQCPNCRKVEKGQWLYGNGGRPLPEFSMDDWTQDEDLYDFSYTEMSFGVGVHWCPFSGIASLQSSFEEGESPSNTFNDPHGHNPNPFFVEHTPVSSTSHQCPYIAYIGPVHTSSSSSSTSRGNVSDGMSFNNHWSVPTAPSEGSYAFPSLDVHSYHTNNGWDHSMFSANSRIGDAEQPPVNQRTVRSSSDVPRPGMHPYVFGHSSASRAPSSITSSMVPPYTNNVTRTRDRAPYRDPFLQAYFEQSTSTNPLARTPLVSARRSRNSAQVPPVASSSDQSGNFYFFSSSSSSGRTFQEPENPARGRFNSWEREHRPSYPVNQGDWDSSIWGPFHPHAGGSEPVMRNGSFRQRNGSDGMQYQNRS